MWEDPQKKNGFNFRNDLCIDGGGWLFVQATSVCVCVKNQFWQ